MHLQYFAIRRLSSDTSFGMHYDLQQNGTQMEGSFFFDNDLFGFMEEWFLELQIVATKSFTPGNRPLKPVPEKGG